MPEVQLFDAVEMGEGEGAVVKRVFPTYVRGSLDPFVLLDEFFVGPDAGFPDHPHRGFEAVTYMLEGTFRHRDSLGNNTEVGAGGVQHFSAGKGLVHSEMPGNFPMNHGLQLWVNLPSDLKRSDPVYQQVESAEIPEVRRDASRIRTIIGEGSPVRLHAGVTYRDVLLDPGGTYLSAPEEGFRGIVYLVQGALSLDSSAIHPGKAVLVGAGYQYQLKSAEGARLVEILGRPLEQRIVIRGSFVE